MEITRTPATSHKFTASVVMAVQFMMQMLSHVGKHVRLKGTVDYDNPSWEEKDFFELPRPCWPNFDFFNRVTVLPIRKKQVEATEECGMYWKVEREVHFEYMGAVVAKLWLRGHRADGTTGNRDNNAFWAVSKIAYAMDVCHHGTMKVTPSDWKTFEFEPVGTSGTSCMFLA